MINYLKDFDLFSGLGTEIVGIIITAILSIIGIGVGVYKYYHRTNITQKQNSGDNSTQIQIGVKKDVRK